MNQKKNTFSMSESQSDEGNCDIENNSLSNSDNSVGLNFGASDKIPSM